MLLYMIFKYVLFNVPNADFVFVKKSASGASLSFNTKFGRKHLIIKTVFRNIKVKGKGCALVKEKLYIKIFFSQYF